MRAKLILWTILLTMLFAGTRGIPWQAAAQIVPEIKEPEGVQEAEECIKCHQKFTPGLVAAFLDSTMGRSGVQNRAIYEEVKKQRAPKEKTEKRKAYVVRNGQITCVLCHGDNHTTITETRGRVSNAVCGGCHDAIDQEYEKAGGHSPDPPEEYFRRSLALPEFRGVPAPILQLSRDFVHSQEGATAPPYYDPDPEFEGTSRILRNGCISCHTRHRFDAAEARRPESCRTCHSGAGNSVFDSYMQSKHGSIYQATGDDWNWKVKMPEAVTTGGYESPTCATCHMLESERYGDTKITHKMTTKSIWGRGLQPLQAEGDQATEEGYKALFQKSREEAEPKRKAMVLVCRKCHSEKFAADYLTTCDQAKLSSDLLVLRARAILDGLARDKLLPEATSALIAVIPPPTEGDTPAGAAKAARPLSVIERVFLEMARHENVRTALGAFHQSPGAVLWGGYAQLQKSLDNIRVLEKEIRGVAKQRGGVTGVSQVP